jgi:hypothetical protein
LELTLAKTTPANAPLGVSSRRAKTMVWLPSIRLRIGTDVLRRPSARACADLK